MATHTKEYFSSNKPQTVVYHCNVIKLKELNVSKIDSEISPIILFFFLFHCFITCINLTGFSAN